MASETRLNKHLTVSHAVALSIGMVVGAGYLIVPGIAYQGAGQGAFAAWVLNGLIVIPLLIIFSRIGAEHPSANGLAGYFGLAFGQHAEQAMQLLVLVTFVLAMPAIAIVGGQYASYVLHLSSGTIHWIATSFFLFACLVNVKGIVISSRVQNGLSFALFTILLTIAGSSLYYGASLDSINGQLFGLSQIQAAIGSGGATMGTVFFAFIGWEMLSFTSEEFKNPRNDFPIALCISFLIVMVLYLGIALAIQVNLKANDPLIATAPISALLSQVFGKGFAIGLSCLAVIIVLANVNSATLAISRLVYASARTGLLPQALSVIDAKSNAPIRAIVFITVCFLIICLLTSEGLLSQAMLFQLTGKTFFLIYTLSVLAYFKLSAKHGERIFGFVSLVLCIVVSSTYGRDITFALAVFSLGWGLSAFRRRGITVSGQ